MKTQIIQITVPDLRGYRTLFVNAAALVLCGLALAFPGRVFPSPETLGLAYDQVATAFAAFLAAINTFLRLLTDRPPAINPLGLDAPTEADLQQARLNGFQAGQHQAKMQADLERQATARHRVPVQDGMRYDHVFAERDAWAALDAARELEAAENVTLGPVIASKPSGRPVGSLAGLAMFGLSASISAAASLPVWLVALS